MVRQSEIKSTKGSLQSKEEEAVDIAEVSSILPRSPNPKLMSILILQAHLPSLTYTLNRSPATRSLRTTNNILPLTSLAVHSQAYPNESPNLLFTSSPSPGPTPIPSPNPFSKSFAHLTATHKDKEDRFGSTTPTSYHHTPISSEVEQLENEMENLSEALRLDGELEMMNPLDEDEMSPFDDVDLGKGDRVVFKGAQA